MWRHHSQSLIPKGRTTANTNGLAGIADARRAHQGQFFTPDNIAGLVWQLAEPSLTACVQAQHTRVAILDNSVGNGRLLQFAAPAQHCIYGCDVDPACIATLSEDAKAAGFTYTFEHCSMGQLRPYGFAAALINPPFSLTLETPNLQPLWSNTHGRFGAMTKAISHRFAVAQALEAAALVIAVVPKTFALETANDAHWTPRLHAIYHLPQNTFRAEGTEVATSLLLFQPSYLDPITPQIIDILDPNQLPFPAPVFTLLEVPANHARLGVANTATITLPVTGDTHVRLVKSGRWIGLQFNCGLTQAKVLNEIYKGLLSEEADLEIHRHPTEFDYTGQGTLLLASHLIQENPEASFNQLIQRIRAGGAQPQVCPSLRHYLRNTARRNERHRVPFGQIIRGTDTTQQASVVVSNQSFPIDPQRWGSPIIKAKEKYQAQKRDHDQWELSQKGQIIGLLSQAAFEQRFGASLQTGADTWITKYHSRSSRFPMLAHQWRKQAEAQGIPQWLSWGYQIDDLIELCLSPTGAVVAWAMGLGKARLGIALCLLRGGTHNLFCVESHLVDEIETELASLPLPPDTWQTIRGPEQLQTLKKINVISYNRLRMPVDPNRPQVTYAKKLRRRIRLVVADEGHLLRHTDTQQTQALWQLAAGIRYVLSGTPIANYPRDLLPIISYVFGDGNAVQPYGLRGAYIANHLVRSTRYSTRGMDQFRDDFVTLQWVTHEFAEEMQAGAKREIPTIKKLSKYRELIAPLIKRRVPQEPDVAQYITIPVPTEIVHTIPWDQTHLDFYLDVAATFRHWYTDQRRMLGQRNINLIALLARIGAVVDAANQPHGGVRDYNAYYPITSKQRAVVKRIQELTQQGKKLILFAASPKSINRLEALLRKEDIASVVMHGDIAQKQRTAGLQGEFRKGETNVPYFADEADVLAELGIEVLQTFSLGAGGGCIDEINLRMVAVGRGSFEVAQHKNVGFGHVPKFGNAYGLDDFAV